MRVRLRREAAGSALVRTARCRPGRAGLTARPLIRQRRRRRRRRQDVGRQRRRRSRPRLPAICRRTPSADRRPAAVGGGGASDAGSARPADAQSAPPGPHCQGPRPRPPRLATSWSRGGARPASDVCNICRLFIQINYHRPHRASLTLTSQQMAVMLTNG